MDLGNTTYFGSDADIEDSILAGAIPSPLQPGILHRFNNIYDYTIADNTSAEVWLNEIRTGGSYRNLIEEARVYGRKTEGYNRIKGSLPCICWNFNFRERRCNENIGASTGLLYYDIDADGFAKENLDKGKVYAVWSSLSNKGISLLVRVSGITPDNFSHNYRAIACDLGIAQHIDAGAKKMVQANVLSFDPAIMVNLDSKIYEADEHLEAAAQGVDTTEDKNPYLGAIYVKKRKEEHIGANCGFFRYHNLADFVTEDGCVTNKAGIKVIMCYLPATINEGKRKHTLLAFGRNLICLNPDKTQDEIFTHIMNKNNKRCSPPLASAEVAGIVRSLLKYKNNGTLKPTYTTRKVIYGPKSRTDKHDRMSIGAKLSAECKREKTLQRLYDAIEGSGDKKITAKSVAVDSGLSIRTVEKYWYHFKDHVRDFNDRRHQKKNLIIPLATCFG